MEKKNEIKIFTILMSAFMLVNIGSGIYYSYFVYGNLPASSYQRFCVTVIGISMPERLLFGLPTVQSCVMSIPPTTKVVGFLGEK